MDTTTRKTEAMCLLALDTLDNIQTRRLNKLTAQQAGYTVAHHGRWYNLIAPDGSRVHWNIHSGLEVAAWGGIPEYCTSVDACLSLPLPPGQRWTTASPVSGSEYVLGWAFIGGGFATTTEIMHRSATLPLAMLLAWWSPQP